MRKRLLMVGLVVVVLVAGLSVVRAAEDTAEPGTPADNECNPGGVLYREENQDGCPSLWYWKAGWFLARFNRGLITRADFPKEFESVLPPLPAPEENSVPVITTICATTFDGLEEWYGCANSDQTGSEDVDGAFHNYVVFVDDSSECPFAFNGLKLFFADDTFGYFTNFYGFTPDEVASIGGLKPEVCIYFEPTR